MLGCGTTIGVAAKPLRDAGKMEDLRCRNLIENARIAKEQDSAVSATEPAGCHCRKAKCVLPAILMAAGNARIAAAWAALILPAIPPPVIRPPAIPPLSPTVNKPW